MDVIDLLPRAAHVASVAAAIDAAPDVADLAGCAGEAREIAALLLADGAGAALVTRLLSQLNDRIVGRVLALAAPRFRLPPAGWCWLGLGSEGRLEQTFVTDQDNGLLFSASDDAEARELRERFLPFAVAVNNDLAACGFPLCEGGVMAGNPRWCLSLDEWRKCFATWVRTPEPEALLNATIFFDFRPLAGDAALAKALRGELLSLTRGNEIFLRMMAANALESSPPLGRVRDFVTDGEHMLDLKKSGSRIFVDAARIFALGNAGEAPGTVERLADLAAVGALNAGDARAAAQAFLAIQALRLAARGNRIDPAHLNPYDHRVLLAALAQARSMQQALRARFHGDT